MRPTKLINYKFGRNFIKSAPWSDSVDWFDASDVQRLTDDLNLRRPKIEFGSSHETFNVWPRPYRVRYARAIDLFTDMMSILNYLDLRSIMVCSGGISTIRYTRSVFTRPFPANFSLSFPEKDCNGKEDRCAVFGCNNDRPFAEKYTIKFSQFCPKSERKY